MRASGILMHVTSLPGPNGIGAMGESARRFVDFLAQAGQRYWQILPLSPTGYGNSPYQSLSTFAGNQYLIDLETLVEEGLLRREEVDAVSWNQQEDRVDYGILYKNTGRFCIRHMSDSWVCPTVRFISLSSTSGIGFRITPCSWP